MNILDIFTQKLVFLLLFFSHQLSSLSLLIFLRLSLPNAQIIQSHLLRDFSIDGQLVKPTLVLYVLKFLLILTTLVTHVICVCTLCQFRKRFLGAPLTEPEETAQALSQFIENTGLMPSNVFSRLRILNIIRLSLIHTPKLPPYSRSQATNLIGLIREHSNF